MNELVQTDVLIIGCGIAGATAALRLAGAGMLDVTVITRAADPAESNTFYAQGGIIYRSHDDSPELLAKDILHAGAGHCSPRAVQILSEEGPPLLKQILLDGVGVPFDRSNGDLSLAREGGHSVPRIAHVADATGKAIEVALMTALQTEGHIRLLTGFTAIDLLTPSHHSLDRHAVYEPQSCVGAYLLDQTDGTVLRCIARHIILATGGLGQIYLNNTNPPGARGDGIAMAYRAGARVINMEFVQFHPTTISGRK